jgi:hypothetical protein
MINISTIIDTTNPHIVPFPNLIREGESGGGSLIYADPTN